MITLIIGGSGSGKSAYAEEYTGMISAGCRKFYIATMQVFDSEGKKKTERHRRLRAGKGFLTIEQPVEAEKALIHMKGTENTALLECMSNLAANEMFSEEGTKSALEVTEKITDGIEILAGGIKNLVIVSNNVFEDGSFYDETTMEYIKAMGLINQRLAVMADKVIEIVVGIPVVIKG